MNNNSIFQIVSDRILMKNGKEFQKLVWDILIKIYPDLSTPKMLQDLGSDGYSVKEKTFFACYAIEGIKYDNDETKEKIESDYKKFCDNWMKKKIFDKWVFITKDNLMGKPHQTITDLNCDNDGITKEQWGLEQLLNLCHKLEKTDLLRIFNIEEDSVYQCNGGNQIVDCKGVQITNIYQNLENESQVGMSIIEEIFNKVLNSIKQEKIKERNHDQRHIDVQEKIELNFTNKEDQEEVRRYFSYALSRIDDIEKRISDEDSQTQLDIESYMYSLYMKNKRDQKPNIKILESLVDTVIPEGKNRDPKYVNLSRAFVLFFFDDCTIFEKTPKEVANALANQT